jgi:acyl carrier protein
MRDYRTELQEIFRDLFDDDEIVLTDELSAKDIPGWDSLNNVKLLVRIEKKLGVRFSTGEVVALKNVGELIALIERRCAK